MESLRRSRIDKFLGINRKKHPIQAHASGSRDEYDHSGHGRGYALGEGYSDGSGNCDPLDAGVLFFEDYTGYARGFRGGIAEINGRKIYSIDAKQVIIEKILGNVAEGCLLRDDLSMSPCYIAKSRTHFIICDTQEEALEATGDSDQC